MLLSGNPGLAEASLEQHPHRRIQALKYPHLAARGLQYGVKLVPADQRDGPAFAGIVLLDNGNLQSTRLK